MAAESATRVGVQIRPEHSSFAEQRAAWQHAEELGVDDVFTWDHFFPLHGDPDGRHFEGWVLLAAMAEVTERVCIGTLVSSVGYRNPDLLADMARTLDHASNGRAILGIGAGWNERDYREYGYEAGTVSDRASLFSDAVPRIVERLSRLNPAPVSDPLPILVGGAGERTTLRLVARYAHIWNAFFDSPQALVAKEQVLNNWCARVGRDPTEIVRSITINDLSQLDDLDEFHAVGLRHVILGVSATDLPGDAIRRVTAWRDRVNGR